MISTADISRRRTLTVGHNLCNAATTRIQCWRTERDPVSWERALLAWKTLISTESMRQFEADRIDPYDAIDVIVHFRDVACDKIEAEYPFDIEAMNIVFSAAHEIIVANEERERARMTK